MSDLVGLRVYHRRADLFGTVEGVTGGVAAVRHEFPHDGKHLVDVDLAELVNAVDAPSGDPLGARKSYANSGDAQASPPKPSVGRIVHYQAYGTPGGEYLSAPRAAIITQVIGGTVKTITDGVESEPVPNLAVGLCILNPTGMFFNPNVPYSETPKPGHWNWPPRVP